MLTKIILLKIMKILKKILNNITKNFGSMKCASFDYYVIINEDYNNDVKELLFLKEKNKFKQAKESNRCFI